MNLLPIRRVLAAVSMACTIGSSFAAPAYAIATSSADAVGSAKAESGMTCSTRVNSVVFKVKASEPPKQEVQQKSAPAQQASAQPQQVSSPAQISPGYMKQMGRISWGGYQWTYYSQRVLPGTGLNIPGRHVNDNGYVCDGSGYICLASDSLAKGSVVSTPFGAPGKIYDAGVGNSYTLDVYVNW